MSVSSQYEMASIKPSPSALFIDISLACYTPPDTQSEFKFLLGTGIHNNYIFANELLYESILPTSDFRLLPSSFWLENSFRKKIDLISDFQKLKGK